VPDDRIPRANAEVLANELYTLFGHTCVRWEIAGSIRRRAHTVKDIEIVAIPRTTSTENLFGEMVDERNEFREALDSALEDGTLMKRTDEHGRTCWGPRHQRAVYKGVAVDVFQVIPPAQWGVVLAIRTGPSDYSRNLVTSVAYGGMMPAGMKVDGGALWRLGHLGEKVEMLPCAEEADFFGHLNIQMPRPEER
jgi:DNA polymerase/3'-5' exonuclease PolX